MSRSKADTSGGIGAAGSGGGGGGSVLDGSWRASLMRGLGGEEAACPARCTLNRAEQLADSRVFAAHPSGNDAVLATARGGASAANALSRVQLGADGHRRAAADVPVPFPSTSAAWAASALALGSSEGRVFVFRQAPDVLDASAAGVLVVPKQRDNRSHSTAAGAYTHSSCVPAVQVGAGARVVGAHTTKLCVWDAEAGAATRHLRVSSGTVLCASLAPAASNDLVATGSATGGATLVDVRAPGDPPWRASHPGVVRHAALSPLLGHVLATASDAGDIKIWDLRMSGGTGPVLAVPHALGPLAGVAWSPAHAELLAATGLSGATKLLNLRRPPSFAVWSLATRSPGIGCAFTASACDEPTSVLLAASAAGEVSSIGLSPTFMESLSTTSASGGGGGGGGGDETEEDCRRLVYLRHLKQAEQSVRAAVKSLARAGDTEAAIRVAATLRSHVPRALPDDCTRAEAAAAFADDLRGCRDALPPLLGYKVPRALRTLELGVRFAHHGKQGEWAAVAQLVGEHLDIGRLRDPCVSDRAYTEEEVERAKQFLVALQPEVYASVVHGLSRHSWTLGVDVFLLTEPLLEECTGMDDADVRTVARGLLGGLVTDTVGDDEQLATSASAPPRVLSAGDHISELRRLRLVTGLLRLPDSADRIINAVEEGIDVANVLEVRSAAVVRLYVSALMHKRRFARVVWAADAVDAAYPRSPAAAALRGVADQLTARIRQGLEKQKKRCSGAAADALQGHALIEALPGVVGLAAEATGLCRRLVYQYHRNLSVHQPRPAGKLSEKLEEVVQCAEEARGVVAAVVRRALSAAPAVRKECEAILQKSAAGLVETIQETPLDKSTAGSLGTLARQAVAHIEALLTSIQV
eukprot:Rhum_TRINITY_DN14524_c20_g1::Rhum_TRINITY_DN14524_c20_g1_i1::g.96743::m.96743